MKESNKAAVIFEQVEDLTDLRRTKELFINWPSTRSLLAVVEEMIMDYRNIFVPENACVILVHFLFTFELTPICKGIVLLIFSVKKILNLSSLLHQYRIICYKFQTHATTNGTTASSVMGYDSSNYHDY